MLNRKLIEKEYAFLKDIIYLGGGEIGLPPQRTQLAGREFMASYMQEILNGGDPGFCEVRKLARAQLAELIGGQPEEIFFTKNTTEGTQIFAMGYPLTEEDNVVTNDLEHAANLHPWLNASRKRGFELRMAKTQNGEAKAEDMIALMDEHTKVVTVSVVQAGTGYFADLQALSHECHKRNAILVVDAIQALGRLDIDVRKLGIDYLSCGAYKGLLSGFGIGFAWCAQELIEQIEPVSMGALSTNTFAMPPEPTTNLDSIVFRPDITRLESGTYNGFGISMLSASTSLLLELGIDKIDSHVRNLEQELRKQLASSQLTLVTPSNTARLSGMIVAYYPHRFFKQVARILEEHNICLTHRPGYLRLVLGIHNHIGQVEAVAGPLCNLRFDEVQSAKA